MILQCSLMGYLLLIGSGTQSKYYDRCGWRAELRNKHSSAAVVSCLKDELPRRFVTDSLDFSNFRIIHKVCVFSDVENGARRNVLPQGSRCRFEFIQYCSYMAAHPECQPV